MLRQLFAISSLAIATLSLNGCASSGPSPYDGLSAEAIYEKAKQHISTNRYHLAIEDLDGLEARYPFGETADKAQLALIYAYYKNDDFDGAAAAAERFITLHPRHPEVSYAYYMKALSHFESSLYGLRRYLPVAHGVQDIEPIQAAFFDFALFLEQFPGDALAPDAYQRLVYLRNLLAERELLAARYYMRRSAPIAAINRAKTVISKFDGTPALPEALSILVQAYDSLGLKDLAQETNFVLQTNYARSAWAIALGA